MPIDPNPERAVVVLGDHSRALAQLAERAREIGHRTVRANTPSAAIELAQRRNLRFSAGLLDPEIPATGLGRVLNEVRRRTRSASLVYLAAGERPSELACARLREAGIELALWDPVSHHDLLFQLNRATSNWTHDQIRGEFRAPSDWETRVFSNGREKPARIYTFSGNGAFLATPRPSLKGADLTMELPLRSGPLYLAGRVVYTHVPGNRRSSPLPYGMAVEFEDTPRQVRGAIRESVAARTADLAI